MYERTARDIPESSIAMNGPISFPDGEMTPIVDAIRSTQKFVWVAKVIPVKIEIIALRIRVFLLPHLSALDVINMLMTASPSKVSVNISPTFFASNSSSFK